MAELPEGYVEDLDYIYGYYPELNHVYARFQLTLAGYPVPIAGNACELGFGQGLSINIHAAASSINWWGTDFNRRQASFAESLCHAAGSGARLYPKSFCDFFDTPDLPQFDFVVMHGVWSWISDDNRASIVEFLNNYLAPGGLLYVSYNALPALAAFRPIRHLFAEFVRDFQSPDVNSESVLDAALASVGRVLELHPSFVKSNPIAVELLNYFKSQDKNYLVHELLSSSWTPMHFSDTEDHLAPIGLSFACPAKTIESVIELDCSDQQQQLLDEMSSVRLRETVADLMVNRGFRTDYWVRGAAKMSPAAHESALRQLRIVLVKPPNTVTFSFKGLRLEHALDREVYLPLLAYLSDFQPHALGDIERSMVPFGLSFDMILHVVKMLVGSYQVYPAQSDYEISDAKKTSDALNATLMRQSLQSGNIRYLSSPVTGGGVPVSRINQLFMLSLISGASSSEDWANYALSVYREAGQRFVSQAGDPIEDEKIALSGLQAAAVKFEATELPIFRALGILPDQALNGA